MTREEAKRFYFGYLGFSFHMDREEPARYNSFRMLEIDKETLRQWDEELLENLFEELRERPDRAWATHGNILQVIRRNNCDTGKYLGRLLDEMERMESLGAEQLTLVIENMAGRTEAMTDGGVHIVCRYPELALRMNDVMERLISACSADPAAGGRFEKAVRTYRSACFKWGRGGRS